MSSLIFLELQLVAVRSIRTDYLLLNWPVSIANYMLRCQDTVWNPILVTRNSDSLLFSMSAFDQYHKIIIFLIAWCKNMRRWGEIPIRGVYTPYRMTRTDTLDYRVLVALVAYACDSWPIYWNISWADLVCNSGRPLHLLENMNECLLTGCWNSCVNQDKFRLPLGAIVLCVSWTAPEMTLHGFVFELIYLQKFIVWLTQTETKW